MSVSRCAPLAWLASCLVFVPLAGAVAQPAAPDVRAAARAVWTALQDAVVTVQVVVKLTMAMGGRQMPAEELRLDVAATVIDPGGLAVASLNALDPAATIKQMMPNVPGANPQVESSISEATLRLADGRDVRAEVVLRDADLDLVFLRPTEAPAAPLPFVDLSGDAPVAVLDDVVVLLRLGRVGNWAPGVMTDQVRAVVDKPRPFVVLASQDLAQEPGQPVFTPAGRVVGILAVRTVQGEGGGGLLASMAWARPGNVVRVVVPAADVREVAKQATAK